MAALTPKCHLTIGVPIENQPLKTNWPFTLELCDILQVPHVTCMTLQDVIRLFSFQCAMCHLGLYYHTTGTFKPRATNNQDIKITSINDIKDPPKIVQIYDKKS